MNSKELMAKLNNMHYCSYRDRICQDEQNCQNCSAEKEYSEVAL